MAACWGLEEGNHTEEEGSQGRDTSVGKGTLEDTQPCGEASHREVLLHIHVEEEDKDCRLRHQEGVLHTLQEEEDSSLLVHVTQEGIVLVGVVLRGEIGLWGKGREGHLLLSRRSWAHPRALAFETSPSS